VTVTVWQLESSKVVVVVEEVVGILVVGGVSMHKHNVLRREAREKERPDQTQQTEHAEVVVLTGIVILVLVFFEVLVVI
jgi:hypothetical protein